MRVALVSSVGRCGIAEHSDMLRGAVTAAAIQRGARIAIVGNPEWLDPDAMNGAPAPDLVHLNYHRGLHSRWTPAHVAMLGDVPVVITFHDTYEVQPDRLPWDLLTCPNVKAMVVHEPCDLLESYEVPHGHNGPWVSGDDLTNLQKVHYWRQGVPVRTGRRVPPPFSGRGFAPTLGTVGFDFPWKNYDMLAEVTGELGWNLLIVGQVDELRRAALQEKNPYIAFVHDFPGVDTAVAYLESCDATAFMYSCANSGTSGAIRLGIAAGRPICATSGCRQFRDLEALDKDRAETGINWIGATAGELREFLIGGVAVWAGPRGYALDVCAFAHQERWPLLGERYLQLYQEAVRG